MTARQYEPTRRETVAALQAHLGSGGSGDLQGLIDASIPHGSIVEALVEDDGRRVAIRIAGINSKLDVSGIRYIDPEALPMILALTLFGGFPQIINVAAAAVAAKHFVYIMERTPNPRQPTGLGQPRGPGSHRQRTGPPPRILLSRLIADAGDMQRVKLGEDHHSLRRASLTIIPGSKRDQQDSRAVAIAEALRLHAKAEDQLGLSTETYEAMIRKAFARFDQATAGQVPATTPEPK